VRGGGEHAGPVRRVPDRRRGLRGAARRLLPGRAVAGPAGHHRRRAPRHVQVHDAVGAVVRRHPGPRQDAPRALQRRPRPPPPRRRHRLQQVSNNHISFVSVVGHTLALLVACFSFFSVRVASSFAAYRRRTNERWHWMDRVVGAVRATSVDPRWKMIELCSSL
jgi:hypothetical protein